MSWEFAFNLIETGSVVLASGIALATVNAWRAEQRRERQLEAATEALELAYETTDAIKAIRSPFGTTGEGSTRKRLSDEPERVTQILDHAYAPIERLNQHQEMFAKMRAMRYRLMAEFGPQWRTAFDEVFSFRAKLITRANMVMRFAHREWKGNRQPKTADYEKLHDELEALRWEEDENDPVNTEMAKVVQRLEELSTSIREDTLLHCVRRWCRRRGKAAAPATQKPAVPPTEQSDGVTVIR